MRTSSHTKKGKKREKKKRKKEEREKKDNNPLFFFISMVITRIFFSSFFLKLGEATATPSAREGASALGGERGGGASVRASGCRERGGESVCTHAGVCACVCVCV